MLYVTSQRGSLSFSNSFRRLLFLFSQPSRLAFPGLPSFFISWILVLTHMFFVVYCVHSTHLYYPICLYKLSHLIRYSLSRSLSLSPPSLSLSLSLCGRGGILFPQMASPCGRGGLWPPNIWHRFPYSLSPAIPSLPRDFALLQAFGVDLRPT